MDFLTAIEEENEEPKLTKKQIKAIKKAEKKEAKRREKIEDVKLIMRDQLERELQLSQANMARLEQEWLEVMMSLNYEDLAVDIKAWRGKLKRNVDTKDTIVKLMLENIEHTEELHGHAYVSHCNTVQKMAEIFNTIVDFQRRAHEQEVEELLRQFMSEYKNFESIETQFLENLENIQINKCLQTEIDLWEDFEAYLHRTDERILSEIMRRKENRDKVVTQMRDMYAEVLKFVNDLKAASFDDNRYERLRALNQRQQSFKQQAAMLDGYELRVGNICFDLQREVLSSEQEATTTIHSLNLELGYFTTINDRYENELAITKEQTMECMKLLAGLSHKTCKHYSFFVERGEKLLSLIAMCRKYETQREKIFFAPLQPDPETQKPSIDLDASIGISLTAEAENRRLAQSLYKRIASVVFDSSAFIAGKKHFESEKNTAKPQKVKFSFDLDANFGISKNAEAEHRKLTHNFFKHFANVLHDNLLLKEDKKRLEAENHKLIEQFKRAGNRVDMEKMKKAISYKQVCKY